MHRLPKNVGSVEAIIYDGRKEKDLDKNFSVLNAYINITF